MHSVDVRTRDVTLAIVAMLLMGGGMYWMSRPPANGELSTPAAEAQAAQKDAYSAVKSVSDGSQPGRPSGAPAATIKTYSNDKYGFSIQYPSDARVATADDPVRAVLTGDFGTIIISPERVLEYGGVDCVGMSADGPAKLAKTEVRWIENKCGDTVEVVVNFRNAPFPWKAGDSMGQEGNLILVRTTSAQLGVAKAILNTFAFAR